MAIIAASVEANGWVLRLDVTGSLGNFASYTLDPDATPRLTLTSDHAGFVASGGQAVAATRNRTLIATKPLRVAAEVVGTTLQPARIDEIDLGGGVIRVRIALSEHIYASDTNLRLAAATAWRNGEAAASGLVVTNDSTVVAPIPIMRWALPQLPVVNGVLRLSLIVFSHHPNGFQPVAGVRFTITDGTRTRTIWTTALATDNSMGDGLRCYTVTVDPATATALTQGLLRCDAEVYPWLGSMRSTDTAGTRAMANLRAEAVSVNAATPFVVGYDPAGTRYGAMWTYIDYVNGTAVASAAMVQPSLALAKAVAPASRPRDITTAQQAGFLVNRTLAVANGVGTSATRSIDGLMAVLAPQTHADGAGSTSVTFGINSPEIPMRIIGDPDDADPRANCILQIQPSRGLGRVSRLLFQNLTWEIGGAAMAGSDQQHLQVDNCIVRGKAGFETDATPPMSAIVPAGRWNFQITRSRWWRTGLSLSQANMRMSLMRAVEHSRLVTCVQIAVKNRVIPPSEDATLTGAQTGTAFSGWPGPTLAGQAEDMIVAYSDIRGWAGRIWNPSILSAATAGTLNASLRRHAFVGNIAERVGADPGPFWGIGESALLTMTYNIIEANTLVGERANTFYGDPTPVTLADVTGQRAEAFVNRIANGVFDRLPNKQDDFNSPTTAAVRVANGLPNHGFRPQMISAWSMLYGVGHEGNYDSRRASPPFSNFALEYYGRRSGAGNGSAATVAFVSDRSKLGSGAGGGDYRLGAASPALARVVNGQCDVDFVGTSRPILADAGVFQTVPPVLAPASGRSSHRAMPAIASWTTQLLPAAGRSPQRAQAATVAWQAEIVPVPANSGQNGSATTLALTFALVPAAATLGLASTSAGLSVATLLTLAPADCRLTASSTSPPLLTDTAAVRATVVIAADPRAIIANRN